MKLYCEPFNLGIVLFLVCKFCAQASNVYVSDSGNGTIVKFDSSQNQSIFASGLNNPTGLAIDGDGNLYVADSGDGTILRFNSSGTASVFASGLNDPTGLAFDNSGSLYVANVGSRTIEKFNPNGSGTVFASGLNFWGPAYLAFDAAGNLYTSTTRTIERFDAAGNGSTVFSTFNYVYGLAFDESGNLFASLQNAGSIIGLNGGGVTFGNPFTASPAGLAFDSSNNLYVTLGGTIEKFDALGGTTQKVSEASGIIFASGLDEANYIAVQNVQGLQPVLFVPEPSTWAMMLAGSGLLLAAWRVRSSCASPCRLEQPRQDYRSHRERQQ